jgi:hypothetical protein
MRIRKIALLRIFAISLMIPAISSFAGIWQDNFDDGNADGWDEVSGAWELKDGMYQQTDMVPEYQKTILEDEDMTDYTLEVDVAILEGGPGSTSVAAGVLLRTDDAGSAGYRFWIRNDTGGFQFSIWINDGFTHVITKADERAAPGETYHLKVQIEGFNISAWVDDRLMFEDHAEEQELFPTGRVGLINYNAHCQYDNLIISGESIVSNMAVASAGKLPVTWGNIKSHLSYQWPQ